jgi:hypothetical protein
MWQSSGNHDACTAAANPNLQAQHTPCWTHDGLTSMQRGIALAM